MALTTVCVTLFLGLWAAVAASGPYASRACWDRATSTLAFGNCCNASDIYFVFDVFAFTKPGCSVCTERGCWVRIGPGLSYSSDDQIGAGYRLSTAVGVLAWGGILAEGAGLGELYSLAMVAVGGAAVTTKELDSLSFGDLGNANDRYWCNLTCPQFHAAWYEGFSPEATTALDLLSLVASLPRRLVTVMTSLPLITALAAAYVAVGGRWPLALMLLLSYPPAWAVPCRQPRVQQCFDEFNDTVCLCPFGLRIQTTGGGTLNLTKLSCPETIQPHAGLHWACVWGSWAWYARDVERPYSHPFLPPFPLTSLCYVSNDTGFIDRLVTNTSYLSIDNNTVSDLNISTCLIDRREPRCGNCRSGCFQTTGDPTLGFDSCGGGSLDETVTFLPLGYFNLTNSSQFWYTPTVGWQELLVASKARHGYGCGKSHGIVNCWECRWRVGNHTAPAPPLRWPLPGKPADVCINPSLRRRDGLSGKDWLSTFNDFIVNLVNPVHCGSHRRGFLEAYPTCEGYAWFPDGGRPLVVAGDLQVFSSGGLGHQVILSWASMVVALMLISGARIVPAVFTLFFFGIATFPAEAVCFKPCGWAVRAWSFVFARGPCVAVINSEVIPIPRWVGVGAPRPLSFASTAVVGALDSPPPLTSLVLLAESADLRAVNPDVFVCGDWPAALTYALPPLTLSVTVLVVLGALTGRWGLVVGTVCAWLVAGVTGLPTDLLALGILLLGVRERFWGSIVILLALQAAAWANQTTPAAATTTPQPWYAPLAAVWGPIIGFTTNQTHVVWTGVKYGWHWVANHTRFGKQGCNITCVFCVDAALTRSLVAGPAIGEALRLDAVVGLLALACVLVFFLRRGLEGALCWLALKASLGYLGILLVGMLIARRDSFSALGLQLCYSSNSFWSDIPVSWLLSVTVVCICFSGASISTLGTRMRMRAYARWCWLYGYLVLYLSQSPVGKFFPWNGTISFLWFVICCFFPAECTWVVVTLVGLAGLLDLLDYLILYSLAGKPSVRSVVGLLDTVARFCDDDGFRAVVHRISSRGYYLYNHMGQISRAVVQRARALEMALEPLGASVSELEAVRDDTYTLVCGHSVGGKPVVARRGDSVLIGWAQSLVDLPPGYEFTAPVIVREDSRGLFSILKHSLTGRDEGASAGQVTVLGTATTRSMGFGLGGVLFTANHSAGGRHLASPSGPTPPRWFSPSMDAACYPLPPGMSCLDICNCSGVSCWVLRRDGHLVHGTLCEEQFVTFDSAQPVDAMKGSSGSPVLCDCGHAVGMLVAVRTRRGLASAGRFIKPWRVTPTDANCAMPAASPPTVPATGTFAERSLILPTGAGKSTKVPASYCADGHRVLVLNPSVATTRGMQTYMAKVMGTAPNIFVGSGQTALSVTTGSKLTYASYGRFLVDPKKFLSNADVVICDECHSTDPTTILGIGAARGLAEGCGVKLLLLATATPPGYGLTAHANITETQLTSEGPIKFYGATLEPDQYKKGRHLIFCHSKNECSRVARELTSYGVPAITFWRGTDLAVIPAEGDVTVCATDALMTGYTGNFETVTDCCCSVTEEVVVDYEPTFTVSLRVTAATADQRAQRRGRCGRGTQGVYRYITRGAPPVGTVSSGAIWSAVEMAIVWYHLDTPTICNYLQSYQDSNMTGTVTCDPKQVCAAFEPLRHYASMPETVRAAAKDLSWPLLTGAQRQVCKDNEAAPPSEDVRWAGVMGDNECPLLFNLHTTTPKQPDHPVAVAISEGLGKIEGTTYCSWSGPLMLMALGVAGAAAFASATGCLVRISTWRVSSGGVPVEPGQGAADGFLTQDQIAIALEELTSGCEWPGLYNVFGWMSSSLTSAAAKVPACADYIMNGAAHSAPALPATASVILDNFKANLNPIMTLAFGIAGCTASPPLAALATGAAAAQLCMPISTRWLCSILVGLIGTLLAGGPTGLGLAGSFVVGSAMGSCSLLTSIVAGLAGYETVVIAARTTLKICCGEASWQDLLMALPGLAFPGPMAGGVVLGLAACLIVGGKTEQTWLNRFLASMKQGSAMPPGYFEEGVKIKELIAKIDNFSLTTLAIRYFNRYTAQGYVECARTSLDRFVEYITCLVQWAYNRAAHFVKSTVGVPLINCDSGWKGDWLGRGSGSTICACGSVVTISVARSLGVRIRAPPRCRSYWRGGFPINTSTQLSPGLIPDIANGTKLTIMTSLGHNADLELRRDGVWLVRTTTSVVTTARLTAGLRVAIMAVDGVCVTQCANMPTLGGFSDGQLITLDGVERIMPVPVRIPKQHFKIIRPMFLSNIFNEISDSAHEEEIKTAHAEVAACEKAVEAVVVQASKDMHASLAARARAEADAWKAREETLGRNLYDDHCKPGADETADGRIVVRGHHDDVQIDGPPADDKHDIAQAPPPSKPGNSVWEPITQGVASPPPDVVSYRDTAVNAVTKSLKAMTGIAEEVHMKTSRLVNTLKKPAARVKAVVDRACEVAREDFIPVDSITTPERAFRVTLDCKSVKDAVWFAPPRETLEILCERAGLEADHEHVYLVGAPGMHMAPTKGNTEIKDLPGEGELRLRALCLDPDSDEEPPPLEGEEKCGLSYIWSGAALCFDTPPRPPISRPIGAQIRAQGDKVYVTDPRRAGERVQCVTIEQREAVTDAAFQAIYNLAKARLKGVRSPGWSYEEAVAKVRPKSAPAHDIKLSVKDLQTATGRKAVLDCKDDLSHGRGNHNFMIRPKCEVFPKTKASPKPPRFIVYPSLEARVAEKMLLGDPSVVAKAILGESYGFQYPPHERVKVLRQFWQSFVEPVCFTVDGKCFDSTVTGADIAREGELFALASDEPDAVRNLHKWYASAPMINSKKEVVGQRNCRASGTLTTSAGNSITCWLKVRAACLAAGIRKPKLLIHGDDVIIICERAYSGQADSLKAALSQYGYETDVAVHSSLDTAESCSAFVADVRTVGGREQYLSTDMRRALARTLAEYGDPLGTAHGYILNYPTHPITRYVLLPLLLQNALLSGEGPQQPVRCKVAENSVEIPLTTLGKTIRALHGPNALAVVSDSPKTLAETQQALSFFGMKGLSHYRRRRRKLKVRLRRAGASWHALASELMWEPNDPEPPPVGRETLSAELLEVIQRPYGRLEYKSTSPVARPLDLTRLYGGCLVSLLCVFLLL